MSITDELRKFTPVINGYKLMRPCDEKELLAIADRIDAEHERGMEERADRYSELRAKMNNCYIELPKDADGETWHLGDTACADGVTVSTVFGVGENKLFIRDSEYNLSWCVADKNRHYHEPTVEDMLWELLGDIGPNMGDEEAVPIVKAYAEKLRLADDGEEQ